jgi:hypothetical protein
MTTESNHVTSIYCKILEGNLEAEGTESLDVALYADMLTAAIGEAYPSADVDVDIEYGCSGAGPSPDVDVDDDAPAMIRSTVEDDVIEIQNRVWVEWCETAAV